MNSNRNDGLSKFKVHFVGIGGISMSSLAVMLNKKGFEVSGSDKNESELTRNLQAQGITVNRAGDAEECDLAVVSSAIPDDDPVKQKLVGLKKAVVSRAWLLARICECYPITVGVAGTHGKTTCTCILAHIMKEADEEFTLHVGGEDAEFSNTYSCGDKVFLTEICEFKRNTIGKICVLQRKKYVFRLCKNFHKGRRRRQRSCQFSPRKVCA